MPNISAITFAKRLANLQPLDARASEDQRAAHGIEAMGKIYDVQVWGFNIASALLISSVALAVLGVISMQAAFVVGAAAWFMRNELEVSLQKYELPKEGFQQVIEESVGEPGDQRRVRRERDQESLEKMLQARERDVYDQGDRILNNLGRLTEKTRDWEPVALTIFGKSVWRNCLPTEA
jgi:hypothetical protein